MSGSKMIVCSQSGSGQPHLRLSLPPVRDRSGRDGSTGGRGMQGFTLLEVMLAVTLLAIVLPVLLGLRNRGLEFQDRARDMTKATLLAQEKLLETEFLLAYPMGEQNGDFKEPPPGLATQVAAESVTLGEDRAPGYRWRRVIIPTPLDRVREVKVQVLWMRGEMEESVDVSNYVFDTSGTGF